MNEFLPTLSAEGERRRQQILGLAIAGARGRRRRRVTLRVVIAGLFAAALVPGFLRLRNVSNHPIARTPPEQHAVPPAPPPIPMMARIQTDPHIVERLAIRPQPLHITLLNDRELLHDLAQANRPAALAYVNGKAMLLYR